MEDCCAVCAEPLEWIGLGPCGHREVCFTCIARLRVVLNDKRCGICRQDCPTVLITKALGDFTRVITDWDALLSHRGVPGLGPLFYDKVVEAYFDDEEPFKIIKAMCRLYCTICEKSDGGDEPGGTKGTMRKGYIFKNIDTLRRHQTFVHKVHMCELCLEGRKVLFCEQKLYSKSQLEQHASRGDSEVDGNEEERGGFAGHPMCAFCRKRFYGDNELYQHMSQEHYTCHMCQRARPGHYEYYRNYDDLEAHFRQEHALCEHAECLAKKFVVFTSEAELKRHNATAHGGHMSRSQRNAALQIPVSFHYRRPGQDGSEDSSGSYSSRRSGRGRGGHSHSANGRGEQLNAAVRASVESADLEEAVRESLVISSNDDSRAGQGGSQRAVEVPNNNRIDQEGSASSPPPPQSSAQGDTEHENSRYLTAVWGAGPTALGDAAFPPLPGASKNARRRAKAKSQGPASMAALLGGNGLSASGRGGIRVLNTAAADSRPSPGPSLQPQPMPPPGLVPEQFQRNTWPEGLSTQAQIAHPGNAVPTPNPPSIAIRGATGGGSMNFGERLVVPQRELGAVGDRPRNQVAPLSMEDIRAANRALVERIRAGLEGNEQQFAAFKEVSSLFRKGEMSSADYYVHIARLGLSYVVPELARLCPDPKKGKELMDAHTAQVTTNNVVDPRSLLPGLAGAFSSTSSLPVTPTNAPQMSSFDAVGGSNSLWSNASQSFPDLGGGGGTSGRGSWSNAPQSSSDIAAGSSGSGSDYAGVASRPVSAPNSLGPPSRARADNEEVEVLSTDGYRKQKGKGRIIDSSSSSSSFFGSSHQVMPSTEGTLFNDLLAARDRTPQVPVRPFPPLISESSYAQPVVPSAVGAGAVSERPSTAGSGPRPEAVWACGMCTLENSATSVQCAACGTGKPGEEAKSVVDSLGGIEKRKKKTPKFQRLRLGDIAASGVLDSGVSNNAWGQTSQIQNDTRSSTRSHGRGVWNNGGGQRLLSMAQRDSIIDDAWHEGK